MSYNIITENEMGAVEREFAEWQAFLNNVVGVAAFTFGLACMGTHSPAINAGISFFFLFLIRSQCRKVFPSTLARLRALAKKSRDFKYMVDSLVEEQLSWRMLLTKYCVFTVGFFFLSIVLISPMLKHFSPIFSDYFGV